MKYDDKRLPTKRDWAVALRKSIPAVSQMVQPQQLPPPLPIHGRQLLWSIDAFEQFLATGAGLVEPQKHSKPPQRSRGRPKKRSVASPRRPTACLPKASSNNQAPDDGAINPTPVKKGI